MLTTLNKKILAWFEITKPPKDLDKAFDILEAEVQELEEASGIFEHINELCDVYFASFQSVYVSGKKIPFIKEIQIEMLRALEKAIGSWEYAEVALDALIESNYSKLAEYPSNDGHYKQSGKYWIKYNPDNGKILKPAHSFVDFKTCLRNKMILSLA